MEKVELSNAYKGKKVFVTGHTGFKGAWLCKSLLEFGADVCGYALEPPTTPALYELLQLNNVMDSIIGDIRNYELLHRSIQEYKPDIVFHLAAQPIVRASYSNPVYTYETNVMGTVHLLEASRHCDSIQSIVNITTDKVYKNFEWQRGYTEKDVLDGFDPYSNSKSCSELVTSSYINSFFANMEVPVSTVRAGNVIGGGDFAKDRIIPDAYRAAVTGIPLELRAPNSVRPYQHVLEAIFIYMYLADAQLRDKTVASSYNVGPDDKNCVTTEEITRLFCEKWGGITYKIGEYDKRLHEAGFLKLDCSKLKDCFHWKQLLDIETAIDKTVEVYREIARNADIRYLVERQIHEYQKEFEEIIKRI